MIKYSYLTGGKSGMRDFDYWLCNHTDKSKEEVLELFKENVSAPNLLIESVSFEEL